MSVCVLARAEASVMRYVVVPVFSNVNGTGVCLGVFLTGDILNGKTPVPCESRPFLVVWCVLLYPERARRMCYAEL
eukprot:50947-Eustigmatos_ZCMA.PRE.1